MAPRLQDLVICFSGNFGPEHPPTALKRWTEQNGGEYQCVLSRETTHLVISEPEWRKRGPEVRAADRHGVKIVSFDWFDDKLRLPGRVQEVKYLWSRMDAAAAAKARKKAKANERVKRREAKEAEKKDKDSRRINWGGALLEHTNEYTHEEARSQESQHAVDFKQGAREARHDILSDNHHIYMDMTGFRYEVRLTKAHALLNRNAVVKVILFETNSTPHSYATIVKHSGTNVRESTSVRSSVGTNYATAFYKFRDAFRTFTGVPWETRIGAFGGGSNTVDTPHRVAAPRDSTPKAKAKAKATVAKVMESMEQKRQRFEREFEAMKFTYRVPGVGEPRGHLPDGGQQRRHKVEQSVYEMFGKAKDANATRRRAAEQAKSKTPSKKKAPVVVLEDSDSDSDDDEMEGVRAVPLASAVVPTERRDAAGPQDANVRADVHAISNNPGSGCRVQNRSVSNDRVGNPALLYPQHTSNPIGVDTRFSSPEATLGAFHDRNGTSTAAPVAPPNTASFTEM